MIINVFVLDAFLKVNINRIPCN